MTRINIIPPRLLLDKHLLAEHREIKRVPNHLKNYGVGCLSKAPSSYVLGTGHVLFFATIGEYTLERYEEIYKQCLERGFDVTSYHSAWMVYIQEDKKLFYKNKYFTNDDIQLSINRILEMLPDDMRYNKRRITEDEYKSMLLKEYPWLLPGFLYI